MKENDLARPVIAWLDAQGWEVYEEVDTGCGRPDLVAAQGRLRWCIELKASFGLDVIAQAETWRRFAHYSSVAVPDLRMHQRERVLALSVCEWRGIGVLAVYPGGTIVEDVKQVKCPALNRRPVHGYFDELRAEQRARGEAGKAHAEYWTPYRQTCRDLREVVARTPRIPLRDAIAAIKHHYTRNSTAISSLRGWIDAGKVPGVAAVRDGGRILLVPRTEALSA